MAASSIVRRRVALSVIGALALLLQPWATPTAAQGPDRVKVLIALSRQPGAADQARVQALGGQVTRTYHLVQGMAATLPATAVAALRSAPGVLAVDPDVRVQAYDAELDLTWGVKRIGAGPVHDAGLKGAGVRVAVFDSGLQYTHFELTHAFAGGWDFVNNDDDPWDDNGHGTHVSGTIGAAEDGQWVVGVAPGVQLFGIKILDASGSGDFSNVIAGLEWAVDHGIQVANHSYGSSADPGTLVAQAFTNAAAAGMVNVAAAGNAGNCRGTGNNISYPARYAEVIAVGATDQLDNRTCYSSTGSDLELAAPGDWIPSSYLDNDIAYGSGTSMASPHVAGAAALLESAGVHDPAQIRQLLDSTAEDLGTKGRDKLYGYGLVNVQSAVAAAGTVPASVFVDLSTDQSLYDPSATSAGLTVKLTNQAGAALSGLAAYVTATFDGVGSPIAFTESGTPGTYTSTLNIAGLAPGQHAVTVSASDAEASGSDTAAFIIGTPPQPGTVHIPSITYSLGQGRNRNTLLITVTALDGNNAPVANAAITVLIYIDGAATYLGQAATDSNGQIVFGAPNAPSGSYYTQIWDVSAGALTWDGVTPPNGFVK